MTNRKITVDGVSEAEM